MLSQQSLLSFMCSSPFAVAYPLFFKVVEFGSFEKGYLNQPPPPPPPPLVMLGQSCHLSADFGFCRHKFLIFFSLFRDALKPFAGHGKGT